MANKSNQNHQTIDIDYRIPRVCKRLSQEVNNTTIQHNDLLAKRNNLSETPRKFINKVDKNFVLEDDIPFPNSNVSTYCH